MNEHDFDGDRPCQLLVCTYGADCAAALKARDGDPQALADALKTARTGAGLKRSLYVTKTGCMGWCEHAPVVQLLPLGLVASGVTIDEASALVRSCVAGADALKPHEVWNYGLSRAENEARRG